MLVFAFAQPIIKKGSTGNTQHSAVELLLDNSFSMQSRIAEVPLLQLVKDRAKEIVNAYGDQDVFLILTQDLMAKHQRYVDQETAIGFIEELQITPSVEPLEKMVNIVGRIRNNLEDYTHEVFILSDFQENISTFQTRLDSAFDVSLIPFRSVQENNIAISSATWVAPIAMKDQSNELLVRLDNFGTSDQAVEMRMIYEGQERPLGTSNIKSGSSIIDTLTVPVTRTGWHRLKLLIDDYPVEFDNELYLTFNIKDQIDVMSIYESEENEFLRNAFESIQYFNLSQVASKALRFERLEQQELVILNDLSNVSSGLSLELSKYVKAGGNLLIFPGRNANLDSYNALHASLQIDRLTGLSEEEKEVGRINTDEFIFNEVYEASGNAIRLPKTERNFNSSSTQSSGKDWLLRYRDGSPFLQKFRNENGQIYLCSAPLNISSSDLVSNAEIFVPMLYKMALSSGETQQLSYTIGEDEVIALPGLEGIQDERFEISGPVEFIPGVTTTGQATFMDIRGQIDQSGYYTLMQDENEMYQMGFNFDRTESNIVYGDINGVKDQMGDKVDILTDVAMADLSDYIYEQREGIQLWRWFLVFGLLFLLIETLLIRFWK